MTVDASEIFARCPRLNNLRGLVPDSVIERELGEKIREFEKYSARAKQHIPTSRLCDVFPVEMER